MTGTYESARNFFSPADPDREARLTWRRSMFVQVVRGQVKPGAWPQVEAWLRRWQVEEAPSSVGYKGEYLLREEDDPDGCLFIALFENAEAAQQASDSPATNAYYRELLTLLEGEPSFINAEVVHHYLL